VKTIGPPSKAASQTKPSPSRQRTRFGPSVGRAYSLPALPNGNLSCQLAERPTERVSGLSRIPQIQATFSAPGCRVLHRIAFSVVSEWYQEVMDYASWVPLRITAATRIQEAEILVYLRQRGDHDRDVQHDHQVSDEDDREHRCAIGGGAVRVEVGTVTRPSIRPRLVRGTTWAALHL
jgi:hypothetical protein